jgi:hypothetical protein
MVRRWIAVPVVLALGATVTPRPSVQTAPAGQPAEGAPRGVAPIEGAERR